MNNPSLTEKYTLNAILMLSAFCMTFVLSACVQTEQTVQSENSKSAVEWPSIESIQGQAFLDQCQKNFDQVAAQFSALETKKKFRSRSEERRVGKECRSRWSPDH